MNASNLGEILPEMLPRLWAFSLRLAGDKYDAEDLVQRTCVRGLERAYQLQQDTAPISWLFSIMHSIWINELRARDIRNRYHVDWNDFNLENLTGPEDTSPETRMLLRQILEAVDRLPGPQRIVMLLVAVEGMSYQDTARILSVPIGTVMSRLSRARRTVGTLFVAAESSNCGLYQR